MPAVALGLNAPALLAALTCLTAIYLLPNLVLRAAFLTASALVAMWVCTLAAPLPRRKGGKRPRGVANDRYKREKVPAGLDAVIIGSGMSGLSCGATLSRMGKKVLVLEQHTVAGGSTHSFEFKGYRFDSGLHYSVPWSGPLFQLSCLSAPDEVPQFTLMGQEDGTFDRVFLGDHTKGFQIKHKEEHLKDLYKAFPSEKVAIDEFIRISDIILTSVKIFAFSKLLPLWLQPWFWKIVPEVYTKYTKQTATEILGKLTQNKELISILCGLWIDTGARPDLATFMLTGAVFRGIPLEGACYPTDGPESLPIAYIETITAAGGRVLTRAKVKTILTTPGAGGPRAIGVELENGDRIHAKTVVSSAGYLNTANSLLDSKIRDQVGIPSELPGVGMSAGFVMANIGIKGSADELKIRNVNVWYHPADPKTKDILEPLQKYYENPLESDAPGMITFPSVKAGNSSDPRTSCQILLMADWKWFKEYAHLSESQRNSNKEYQALKKRWEDKCLDLLFRFYPQVKAHVDFTDVSTPLSIKHYLQTPNGGAVGLDQTPGRYTNWEVQKHLDISTPITNLYMTGQDQLICGVVLAQLCGVVTAFRMGGFISSARVVLQSIFLL